jgi:hypothetical protein
MEKSSQIAWKIVPLRHFSPLKVVPLIEVLLYIIIRIPSYPMVGHTVKGKVTGSNLDSDDIPPNAYLQQVWPRGYLGRISREGVKLGRNPRKVTPMKH